MTDIRTGKPATVTTPTDREIVTTRVFHAPRALVWRTLTEPELLARWWERGRTRITTNSLFHTPEERDGMLETGMEKGLNERYAALDRVLADLD